MVVWCRKCTLAPQEMAAEGKFVSTIIRKGSEEEKKTHTHNTAKNDKHTETEILPPAAPPINGVLFSSPNVKHRWIG